jgi:hypothetical protein
MKKAVQKVLASVLSAAVCMSTFPMANAFAATKTDSTDTVSTVDVTVKGDDVAEAAKNVNGLTFKGFGVLSGNSTSALLMDYKAEYPDQYWKMMRILFGGAHPIMNMVKIEMGNDHNTSTGPEACTMRTENEYPNVEHEPGFQLAADAKRLNPNVRVCILRWCAPSWANNNDKIYKWYKNTVLAVYRKYGYMVNYINPGVNESKADVNWTKQFASEIKSDATGFISDGKNQGFQSSKEEELFHQIKTVISDEASVGSFGGSMMSDETLRNAVDVAGYHYSPEDDGSGNFKKLAETYDKEVWNSEAQATFSNSADRPNDNVVDGNTATGGSGIGGNGSSLEMANTIIKGYMHSRRTEFIYQPAISSFYEGGQYSSKELINACNPWSGYIYYDVALDVLEHFSQFSKTGWENSDNTAGIWRFITSASQTTASGTNPVNGRNGEPNYVTLASPDKKDFSTVIVNDSAKTQKYRIKAEDMNLGSDAAMEVWETRAADDGQTYDANYKKFIENLQPDQDGYYTYTVKPWSVVTMTTLDCEGNKEYTEALPHANESDRTVLDTDFKGKGHNVNDDTLYADDFDYTNMANVKTLDQNGSLVDSGESFIESRGGESGCTPLYTHDMNGAFEAYKQSDGNYVLRQQCIDGSAGSWNRGDPTTVIGDSRWANYKVSTDFSFENYTTGPNAPYVALGAREQGRTQTMNASAYVIKIWADAGWELDRYGQRVSGGNVIDNGMIYDFDATKSKVHNVALQVAGNQITAWLDGVKLTTFTDSNPQYAGRIQLGCGYTHVCFDNLKVQKVSGYIPYYSEIIDDMHMKTWSNPLQKALVYNNQWTNKMGGGMYELFRTTSTSTGKGATLSYTFTGTGLDLFGANNGQATLNIFVDGKQIAQNAKTQSNGNLGAAYSLRGIENGKHTVTFETANASPLVVDFVGVVTGNSTGNIDTTPLEKEVNLVSQLKEINYNPQTWSIFENDLAMAKKAVSDPKSYGLDREGMNSLLLRLQDAQNALVNGDIGAEVIDLGEYAGVATPAGLPETMTVKQQKVNVIWDKGSMDKVAKATPFTQVALTGMTAAKLSDGYRYKVTAKLEVVPIGLQYFIDSGASDDAPEYKCIRNNLTGLLNDHFDQSSTNESTWGHITSFNSKSSTNINDKSDTGVYYRGDIVYCFPLKAGTYTLSAGFTSWSWYQYPTRNMVQHISYTEDSSSKTVSGDTINLDSAGVKSQNLQFTLTQDQTVTYTLSKTGNQDVCLSWLAISKSGVEFSYLRNFYNQIQNTPAGSYTNDSWKAFNTALTNAAQILKDQTADQTTVTSAYQALNDAYYALSQKADKAKLQTLYDSCTGKTRGNYTADSWKAFEDALKYAKSILPDENASQESVNGVLQNLQNAINGLKVNSSSGSVTPSEPTTPTNTATVADVAKDRIATAAVTKAVSAKDFKAVEVTADSRTTGKVTISVPSLKGRQAYVYLLNAVGQLELQAADALQVSEEGKVDLTVAKGAKYVLILASEKPPVSSVTGTIEVPQGYTFPFDLSSGKFPNYMSGNAKVGETTTYQAYDEATGKAVYGIYGHGAVGDEVGIYANGVKLFVVKVTAAPYWRDTSVDVAKKQGQTYWFKVKPDNANAKVTYTAGNGAVASTLSKGKQKDGSYLFGFRATGKPGQSTGLYATIDGKTYCVFRVNMK